MTIEIGTTINNTYYNRFHGVTGFKNKKYVRNLYRAGRGLQSAELNEDHDFIMHQFQQLSESLYSDGSIIKGGKIVVTPGSNPTASISEAIVFVSGYFIQVPAVSSLSIAASGSDVIGFAAKYEVITENDDPSLNDPAVGTRNYGSGGAAKLKFTARWCKPQDKESIENFYPIFEFLDGMLLTKELVAPEMTAVQDLLATYDYNANGSYVICGLKPSYITDNTEAKTHIISISDGKANVEGYYLPFNYSHTLSVPMALDTWGILAETKIFSGNNYYETFFNPIAEVSRITGVKQTSKIMVKGPTNGQDRIDTTDSIISIESVVQGGTQYQVNVDYRFISDNNGYRIDWSPGGNEPGINTQYTITYNYRTVITTGIEIDSTRTKVKLEGFVTGTEVLLDYTYYLPRIDSVYLLKNGDFTIVKGVPDDFNPQPPESNIGLKLCDIYLSPMGIEPPTFVSDYLRAYRMSDIKLLFQKVEQLQYDVARLALLDNSRSKDPTNAKKTIFVDPFIDDALRDPGAEGSSDKAIALDKMLRPNINWSTYTIITPKRIKSISGVKTALSQPQSSGEMKINEFSRATPIGGYMFLTPDRFSWINRTIQRVITLNTWGTRKADSVLTVEPEPVDIPSGTQISIQAGRFNANEPVKITFDDIPVPGSYSANASGILTTTITVPQGAKSGSKLVKAVGTISGQICSAVFVAEPLIRTTIITEYRPPIIWYDPLGQTFTLQEDAFIHSISLKFSARPLPAGSIYVYICETIAGFPNSKKVLGIKKLDYADINLYPNYTEFVFDDIIFCKKDVEYAFVVVCADDVAKIKYAELGAYSDNNQWITSQPYTIGTLVQSSNQSTWSVYHTRDLTFTIKSKVFSTSDETITLGQISNVSGITDLMLLTGVDNYPSTAVEFRAVLNRSGTSEIIRLFPYVPVSINKYSGDITLVAVLSTKDSKYTPVIERCIQLGLGVASTTSVYCSELFPLGTNATLKVYIDVLDPTNSKVAVAYWSGSQWVTMSLTSQVEIGDGWYEKLYTASGISATNTQVKITLTTDNTSVKPYVSNLRALVI